MPYNHDPIVYTEIQFHEGVTTLADIQAAAGVVGSQIHDLIQSDQGKWYVLWGTNIYLPLQEGVYISIQTIYPTWPNPPSAPDLGPYLTDVRVVSFSVVDDPRFTATAH